MWQCIFHRVVVDVGAIDETDGFGGVFKGFVVAGNDFGDGDFMTAIQITLYYTMNVDFWVFCTDEEEADKETCGFCLTDEFNPSLTIR